jgi:cell pole-organizing protein PopZ
MEEILASIRRIIADDQMIPLTRPSAPQADVPPASDEISATADDLSRAIEEATADLSDLDEADPAEPHDDLDEAAPQPAAAPPPFGDLRRPVGPPRQASRPAAPAPASPAAIDPPPAPAEPVSEPEEPQEPEPGDSLLSATTGASVSSAFSALTTTMFLQNTGMVEEAVRELLRPMLKQWLDDNLPVMVERLVRAEIERVARGGR